MKKNSKKRQRMDDTGSSPYFSPAWLASLAFDWGGAYTDSAMKALASCPLHKQGVRHLCVRGCYWAAYEPMRCFYSLWVAAASRGASEVRTLKSIRVFLDWEESRASSRDRPSDHESDGRQQREGEEDESYWGWRVKMCDADGRFLSKADVIQGMNQGQLSCSQESSSSHCSLSSGGEKKVGTPVKRSRTRSAEGPWFMLHASPSEKAEDPPASPFGLLEELFCDDPWKLLLCCILLNQTTRRQVDPVLTRFLKVYPSAEASSMAQVEDVAAILRPLGLRKRANGVIRFSAEFCSGTWRRPCDLPWVGRYGEDAFCIFCGEEGRVPFRERCKAIPQPQDHALRAYMEWAVARNFSMDPAQNSCSS
jgi:methyl-CpG-binding domain protein 4